MVHPRSQWWVIKLVVYLEVIVREMFSFVLTWQVWDPCPWWLRLVSFRKKIRYSDSSRYLSGVVSGKSITTCIHYLLLVDIHYPFFLSSIRHWHPPIYIGIGMAVNPRKCEVITLRVITLKVIALSDHNSILNKVLKNFCKKTFSIESNLICKVRKAGLPMESRLKYVCEVVLEVEDVEVDEGEDEAEARLVDVHG